MIAILFLLLATIFGWCISSFFLDQHLKTDIVRIIIAFLLGSFAAFSGIYFAAFFLSLPFAIAYITLCIFSITALFIWHYHKDLTPHLVFSWKDMVFFILLLLFSYWFFGQSLHYTTNGILSIGKDTAGDFELHLPLIRSFSMGSNIPPSLLTFPNTNLAYHFMYDFAAGVLEALGLPLSYAYNGLSILALSSLLFGLYKFAQKLFNKGRLIGILSVIFFLFNSTLTFVEGYSKLPHQTITDFLTAVWNNKDYLSAGPFTSDHVSIIWNLNVYANQRHLIYAFALAIALLLLFLHSEEHRRKLYFYIGLGIIWGLLPFWNMHTFIGIGVIVVALAIFRQLPIKQTILFLLVGGLLALPQIAWLARDVNSPLVFNPGFLADKPLTIQSWTTYWIYNTGLSLVTITLGFLWAQKKQRYWLLAIMGIFVLGNLFQFNREMFNNHKLFNFWILLANTFSAFALVKILERKFVLKWLIVILCFILLTGSGIMDFMVVKNQPTFDVIDYQQNPFTKWVIESTPSDAVFLIPEDSYYHSIRMAGRKTFGKDPRFADTFGYDVAKRDALIDTLYAAKDSSQTDLLLSKNHISYVLLSQDKTKFPTINYSFFEKTYKKVFTIDGYDIYQVF